MVKVTDERAPKADPLAILRETTNSIADLPFTLVEQVYRIELDHQFSRDRAETDRLIRAAVAKAMSDEGIGGRSDAAE